MIKKFLVLMVTVLLISPIQASVVEFTASNFVALTEEVNDTTISEAILGLERNNSPIIYLYINSPGGSIPAGILLVNYLLSTKKKVVCIANYAASMAHAILEACPIRLGTPTNILLQHRASLQAQGSLPELEAMAVILKGLEDFLNKLESERIGMPLKLFQSKVNPMWVTFGEDSVKQNLIDGVTDIICAPELYAKVTSKRVNTMFGGVNVLVNGCPLLEPQIDHSLDR